MALVPATSPTNSNGNFDPSFLSPPRLPRTKQSFHPPPRPRPRPPPSPSPFSSKQYSLCLKSSSCRIPPSFPAPALPSSSSFDRAVGDVRKDEAFSMLPRVALHRASRLSTVPPHKKKKRSPEAPENDETTERRRRKKDYLNCLIGLKMLTNWIQLWQARPLRHPGPSLREQQTVSTPLHLIAWEDATLN